MKKIAITGSISSGKTTVLTEISTRFPVFNCDATIAKFYEEKSIQHQLKTLIPQAFVKKIFQKKAVLQEILINARILPKLEAILYPHLHKKMVAFEHLHRKKGTKIIFFEVPLLFEKNLVKFYDNTIFIASTRRKRLYNFIQKGGNPVVFHTFNNLQFSDAKKLCITRKHGGKVLNIHNIKAIKPQIERLTSTL